MAFKKCPRCELNYILDGADLCTVCREEVRGMYNADDIIALCSVCGELPALPGEDMCKACLAELRSIETLTSDGEEDEAAVETNELKPDPVSDLDEIEEVDSLDDGIDDVLEEDDIPIDVAEDIEALDGLAESEDIEDIEGMDINDLVNAGDFDDMDDTDPSYADENGDA